MPQIDPIPPLHSVHGQQPGRGFVLQIRGFVLQLCFADSWLCFADFVHRGGGFVLQTEDNMGVRMGNGGCHKITSIP